MDLECDGCERREGDLTEMSHLNCNCSGSGPASPDCLQMARTSVIISQVSSSSYPAGQELRLAQVCRECGQESSCVKHNSGSSCFTSTASLRRVTVTGRNPGSPTVSPDLNLNLQLLPLLDIKLSHDNFLFQVTQIFQSVLDEASLFSSCLSPEDLLTPSSPSSHFPPALVLTAGLGRLLRRNLPQLSVVILAMFFSPERQSFRWDFSPGDIKLLRQLRQRLSYSREIKKCQLSQHLGLTVTEFIFQAVSKLAQLPRFALVLLVLVSVFTSGEEDRVDQQRGGYLNIIQQALGETKHLAELSAHLPEILDKLDEGCRYLRDEKAPRIGASEET